MKTTRSLILAFGLSSALLNAQTTIPDRLSYQGRVVDATGTGIGTGTPVNRKIIFRLFDAATGGNRLWSEEQTVTLAEGNFSVLLGQGVTATYNGTQETPRPSLLTVFGGAERYLEIVVDGGDGTLNATDTAIAPRQRLTSAAFAVRAASADSVAQGTTLNLNGSPDNGLGWYGTGRLFAGQAVNGPVLFGQGGGALGAANGTTQTTAMRWDAAGNIGIATAPVTDFKLDIAGQVRINSSLLAAPSNSVSGGQGMRLVVWPGSATSTPYGFGMEGGALYSVVPATASHKWYGGTTERMSLNGSNGNLTVTGTINGGTINNGHISGNTLKATSATATHSGGAYLEWNRTNGDGATWLLNQRGLGTGGIRFGEVDTAKNFTENLFVPAGGGIVTRGGVALTAGTLGVPTGANPDGAGQRISFWQDGGTDYSMGMDGNTLWSAVPTTAKFSWHHGTTETMRLDVNGLGIRTNSPQAPLHVAGNVNSTFHLEAYLDGTGAFNTAATLTLQTSIIAEARIRSGQGFDVASDSRIKKVVGKSSSKADLEMLGKIEITDYTLIDTVQGDRRTHKKVIAQQLEKTLPAAVNRNKGVVPDIMQKAPQAKGWITLKSDLKVGERVRLLATDKDEVQEVLEVKKDQFRTKLIVEDKDVFVYGREVNDFRSVDYDAISMLNVSATQELKRQKDEEIAALKAENAALKAELEAEAKVNQTQENRLAALEKAMAASAKSTTAAKSTASR